MVDSMIDLSDCHYGNELLSMVALSSAKEFSFYSLGFLTLLLLSKIPVLRVARNIALQYVSLVL